MAYSITYDEQDTGFFSTNANAYTDAPNSTSTQFYLAPGLINAAKGLLTAVSGFGDRDAYSLGFLYAGTYTFSASGGFWFFGSGYASFPAPTLSVFLIRNVPQHACL